MSGQEAIDKVIEGVIAREGGYVNDPRDAGGETNWGITVAVARANGWTGPMKDLPRDRAAAIYRKLYVEQPRFDMLASVSEAIAAELVDTGVNMGPKVAATFLQRALNAFNDRGRVYPDIVVDGDAGVATRNALRDYLERRGPKAEKVMLAALNALQGARYIELAENRSANEAFAYGWIANRVAS
jgi:lysozyme family protein